MRTHTGGAQRGATAASSQARPRMPAPGSEPRTQRMRGRWALWGVVLLHAAEDVGPLQRPFLVERVEQALDSG